MDHNQRKAHLRAGSFVSFSGGVLILLSLLANTRAADWPCFRGSDGLGVSSETGLPVEWGKDKNVAWRIAIPGKGASAPIIVGDRIYVTTQTEDLGLHILAIDRKNGTVI